MDMLRPQFDDKYVLLTHPVHGEQNTVMWVADALLGDEGSGWKRVEVVEPVAPAVVESKKGE
jgi:hypothetical protein